MIEYVESLRDAGVVVTGSLVAATATGVVKTFRPAQLKQNGGTDHFGSPTECFRKGYGLGYNAPIGNVASFLEEANLALLSALCVGVHAMDSMA